MSESTETSFLAALAKFFLSIGFGLITSMYYGWVLMTIWGWFAVAGAGMAAMPYLFWVAMPYLWNMLRLQSVSLGEVKKAEETKWVEDIAWMFIKALLALLVLGSAWLLFIILV